MIIDTLVALSSPALSDGACLDFSDWGLYFCGLFLPVLVRRNMLVLRNVRVLIRIF